MILQYKVLLQQHARESNYYPQLAWEGSVAVGHFLSDTKDHLCVVVVVVVVIVIVIVIVDHFSSGPYWFNNCTKD